jgi:hypothetical protein
MAAAPPMVTLITAPNQPPNLLLDQYKAYVSDLGNIGTRYTTSQSFYWTIVSALVAVLAIKDAGPSVTNLLKPTFVAIMGLIAAICLVWWMTSRHYRKLFGAKLQIIKQLEDQGLYTIYRTEGEILRAGGDKVPSLLAIEGYVPPGLMLVALVLAAVAVCHIVSSM